jgi:hypothetical protein
MSTEEQFLTVEDVAARYSTSVEAIERAMAAGLLPPVKGNLILGWPLATIREHELTMELLVESGWPDPYRDAGFTVRGVPIDAR